MKKLNQDVSVLAVEFGLCGGTDVTGFSLLGHGSEMAEASHTGFRLDIKKIPFVSCAHKYAKMWTFPGGASDNRLFFGPRVRFTESISEEMQMLLFDPQTSGGLLLAVPNTKIDAFLQRAKETDLPVWVIGEAVEGSGIDVV
jgi:selenide,water dikinase